MDAWIEIEEMLAPGEAVEAVVFGPWGWGSAAGSEEEWELGFKEPSPPPVPFNMRGKVLTPEAARPLMQGWRFYGGYGAPEAYACNIWTSQRVLWVTQYDGSTSVDSAPRNPIETMPDMPGG